MTITSTTNTTTFPGTGAQTVFDFDFVAGDASYIVVTYTNASGVNTVLTPSQFTLAINDPAPGALWGVGGSVTYPLTGSPIAVGTSLTVERDVPNRQLVSLTNQGSQMPQSTERGLDLLEMQLQGATRQSLYAFTAPVTDPTPPLPTPSASVRANKGAAFDVDGNLTAGVTPATGFISTAMQAIVGAATVKIAQTLLDISTSGVVNVLANGIVNMVGDGSDETTKLQQILDAITASGVPTLLLMPGTSAYYGISHVTYACTVPLCIDGMGGGEIISSSVSGQNTIELNVGTGVFPQIPIIIRNIEINGVGNAGVGGLDGSGLVAEKLPGHLYLQNVSLNGHGAYGYSLADCYSHHFVDVHTNGNGLSGFYLKNNSGNGSVHIGDISNVNAGNGWLMNKGGSSTRHVGFTTINCDCEENGQNWARVEDFESLTIINPYSKSNVGGFLYAPNSGSGFDISVQNAWADDLTLLVGVAGTFFSGTFRASPTAITLTSCTKKTWGPIYLPNSSAITDDSPVIYDTPNAAWRSYTPTWGKTGGSGFAVGNAILVGDWRRVGDTCEVSIQVTVGSTTTIGSGGFFTFSLPFPTQTTRNSLWGTARWTGVIAASSPTTQFGDIIIFPSVTTAVIYNTAGVVGGGSYTLAAGDTINLFFTYATTPES